MVMPWQCCNLVGFRHCLLEERPTSYLPVSHDIMVDNKCHRKLGLVFVGNSCLCQCGDHDSEWVDRNLACSKAETGDRRSQEVIFSERHPRVEEMRFRRKIKAFDVSCKFPFKRRGRQ